MLAALKGVRAIEITDSDAVIGLASSLPPVAVRTCSGHSLVAYRGLFSPPLRVALAT
jgi:hypothetical protein